MIIRRSSRQPVEQRRRLVHRERAPGHRLRNFLRRLRVEPVRLDERAAEAVYSSHSAARRSARRLPGCARKRSTVDLVHDPEQRHQVRSILKPGGRVGTLSARCGLQSGHGSPAPLQPSCPIGLSGCSSQVQRVSWQRAQVIAGPLYRPRVIRHRVARLEHQRIILRERRVGAGASSRSSAMARPGLRRHDSRSSTARRDDHYPSVMTYAARFFWYVPTNRTHHCCPATVRYVPAALGGIWWGVRCQSGKSSRIIVAFAGALDRHHGQHDRGRGRLA